MYLKLWAGLAMASTVLAQGNLGALIASQPDLSTLLSLVQLVPGLNSTLSTSSNITILAPTNQAFAEIPRDIPEGIAVENRNATSVAALLANHVFKGFYPSSEIGDIPTFVQSMVDPSFRNNVQPFTGITGGQYNGLIKNGEDVDVLSGELTVSRVTEADIPLGEGIIIHKISTALSFGPPFLTYAARAQLRGINGAITTSGLDLPFGLTDNNTLTDFTIFAPNDEAFENIASVLSSTNQSTLQEVLQYHILEGNIVFSPSITNTSVTTLQGGDLQLTVLPSGDIFVNGARVLFPNVILSNGVVHVIDSVLNPLAPPPSREELGGSAPVVAFPNATSSSPLPFTSFAFSEDFQETYTTAPLLSTLLPVNATAAIVSGNATATSTQPAIYTGGAVQGMDVVEVVKVLVAVVAVSALGGQV